MTQLLGSGVPADIFALERQTKEVRLAAWEKELRARSASRVEEEERLKFEMDKRVEEYEKEERELMRRAEEIRKRKEALAQLGQERLDKVRKKLLYKRCKLIKT